MGRSGRRKQIKRSASPFWHLTKGRRDEKKEDDVDVFTRGSKGGGDAEVLALKHESRILRQW